MKAEHVNAFLVPSVEVLQKMARTEVTLGPVMRLQERCVDDHISIIIGLQGRLCGSVVFSAAAPVAWALASRIAGSDLGGEDEEEVRTILAELANTIVGNATGHLYELGFREGITPPTVVAGNQVSFDFGGGTESVQIPLDTDLGRLDMIVSLAREAP